MRTFLCFTTCLAFASSTIAQSEFSILVPAIWSKVQVKDNWTPSTAVNYKEYLSGTAFGSGISVGYSFQPTFLIKNKAFRLEVSLGYFKQQFDVNRAFDYSSPAYVIFRTEAYAYYCWNWAAGLSYTHSMHNYCFVGKLSYGKFNSFRQEYKPTSDDPPQVNEQQLDFARAITISIGLKRTISDRFVIGVNLIVPYTWWRNDRIFRDDPSTSFSGLSFGTSISLGYQFKKNN
jgi:hypothetical protein